MNDRVQLFIAIYQDRKLLVMFCLNIIYKVMIKKEDQQECGNGHFQLVH